MDIKSRLQQARHLHATLAGSDHITAIQDSQHTLDDAEAALKADDTSTAQDLLVLAEEQLECINQ
jgi:hypothetical protein